MREREFLWARCRLSDGVSITRNAQHRNRRGASTHLVVLLDHIQLAVSIQASNNARLMGSSFRRRQALLRHRKHTADQFSPRVETILSTIEAQAAQTDGFVHCKRNWQTLSTAIDAHGRQAWMLR